MGVRVAVGLGTNVWTGITVNMGLGIGLGVDKGLGRAVCRVTGVVLSTELFSPMIPHPMAMENPAIKANICWVILTLQPDFS